MLLASLLRAAVCQEYYTTCSNSQQDLLLQHVGCDVTANETGKCTNPNKTSGMCLQGLRQTSSFDCLDFCSHGYTTVSWTYNENWINNCDPSCKNFYYQRCKSDADCREGTCCSLPSPATIKAGGCGPPSCFRCIPNDGNGTQIISCSDCGLLGYGTCIESGTQDIRPGYSCSNDPCLQLETYAPDVCGYYAPTNSFPSTRKACSEACQNAISGVLGCPNLAAFLAAYQNYDGCRLPCGDFFYQRCADTSDCPVGYCCSLPPKNPTLGFFDNNTCGPPATCTCKSIQFATGGFTESTACSTDCGSRELGTCQEVGSVDTYNPLYSCDCTDPWTFNRTASPTEVLSSTPSSAPSPPSAPSPSLKTSPSKDNRQSPNPTTKTYSTNIQRSASGGAISFSGFYIIFWMALEILML